MPFLIFAYFSKNQFLVYQIDTKHVTYNGVTIRHHHHSSFCNISKNTFFTEHLRATASDRILKCLIIQQDVASSISCIVLQVPCYHLLSTDNQNWYETSTTRITKKNLNRLLEVLAFSFKVACRVKIQKKKILFENSEKFGYSFIKSGIIYMYLSFIYKTPLIQVFLILSH